MEKPAKRTLVIEVDVTGWTDEQIQSLDMHMSVQLEAAEDGSYPDAESSVSRIVDQYKPATGNVPGRVMSTWLAGVPNEAVTSDPRGAR